MKKIITLILALSMVFTIQQFAFAKTGIYVATSGSDSNDGSMAAPFKTLQKAIDTAAEGDVVFIREGTYNESVKLKSGITVKAFNNEKVVFSAAQKGTFQPLTEDEKKLFPESNAKKAVVSVSGIERLGDIKINGISPELLYNDTYGKLATLQNDKVLHFTANYDSSYNSSFVISFLEKKSLSDGMAKYIYKRNTTGADTAPSLPSIVNDIDNLYLYGSIGNRDIFAPVTHIDSGSIEFTDKDCVLSKYGESATFVYSNAAKFIDEPGEWFADRDNGKLYFYPGTDVKDAEFLADTVTFFSGENISNVSVCGIDFTKTLGCGINIKDSKVIKIESCNFKNVSDSCVKLDGCDGVTVYNCDFNTVGGVGTEISGNNCVVDNCNFNHTGELYNNCFGGVTLKGDNNKLSHNNFAYSPLSAISVDGSKNIIEQNNIGNTLIKGSYYGAIYINENAIDNIITNNFIHDIDRPPFIPVLYIEDGKPNFNNSSKKYTDKEKKEITDAYEKGDPTSAGNAITLQYKSSGTIIKNNLISEINYGVKIISSNGNSITNNVFNTTEEFIDLSNKKDDDNKPILPENNIIKTNVTAQQDNKYPDLIAKNTIENNVKLDKNSIMNRDLTFKSDIIAAKLPEFEMFSVPDMGRQKVKKEDIPAVFNNGLLLLVGSNNASSNGVITKLDASARIIDGRTLVPVRYISEAFGQSVDWNADTQTVTIGDNISITIGNPSITVSGTETPLDVPAGIYDSRTYVPLRAIAEALGKSVHWDDSGLIVITDKETTVSKEDALKLVEILKG